MKKITLFLLFFLGACSSLKVQVPKEYSYVPIKTKDYILASWQKISNDTEPLRIYIEGDGNAYNSKGYPTNDPSPKSNFVRNFAFNDNSSNVVYLARPCQYIKSNESNIIDWTTGRFSQKIVDNMTQAIKEISKDRDIILIGYSGGALISGLIINQYKDQLNIIQWITIAGLLNHTQWTKYFNYLPLKDSLDLETIPNIKQKHFVGKKDKIVPYQLTLDAANKENCIILNNATHNKGFEDISF
ncbi:MAG: hypothetical protein J6U02_01830 [Elusimicrobia bacterium]|nr:hypothetical protein [Elusimicrobiota bacterium]